MRKSLMFWVLGLLFGLSCFNSLADDPLYVYTETRSVEVGFNIVTDGPDAEGFNSITITNGEIVSIFRYNHNGPTPPLSLSQEGGVIIANIGKSKPYYIDGYWYCCSWILQNYSHQYNSTSDRCDGDACSGPCCNEYNLSCYLTSNPLYCGN